MTTPERERVYMAKGGYYHAGTNYESWISSRVDYSLARDLTLQIASDYSIPVTVWFRNRQNSYHRMIKRGEHEIVYGYESVRRCYRIGFKEYSEVARMCASVRHLFSGKKELEAIRVLAVHESAHMVDTERNGRPYGVAHGPSFCAVYRELLKRYI